MLNPPLNQVEVRVLGSLLEKAETTPDNYPLSLSALAGGCNQLSNREPVMQLSEDEVLEAVVALRRQGLVRAIQPAGSRVTKYQHLLDENLGLDRRQLAVLAVLMLRGPQTVGELHARTGRLADFADLAEIEATVETLLVRQPEALVARLGRRAGQKEDRFAQVLSGAVAAVESHSEPAPTGLEPARPLSDHRIAALERTVEELRAELAALRSDLIAFRSQFQ